MRSIIYRISAKIAGMLVVPREVGTLLIISGASDCPIGRVAPLARITIPTSSCSRDVYLGNSVLYQIGRLNQMGREHTSNGKPPRICPLSRRMASCTELSCMNLQRLSDFVAKGKNYDLRNECMTFISQVAYVVNFATLGHELLQSMIQEELIRRATNPH